MKVVILAGGLGTRISEESHLKPKPMIEIGDMPILWHIMKEYSHYGFHDFIICAGYKQHIIKQWFNEYYMHMSDVTFDFCEKNKITIHNNISEPWKVTIVDTGLNTMTGGRVKRIEPYINGETFMLTYGDGVCDVNIQELLEFHKSHGRIATITAVNTMQRFGVLDIADGNEITNFSEKIDSEEMRINGGYMVFEPEIFNFIEGDSIALEKSPMNNLSSAGELMAYRHDGFWQCMDTKREHDLLEKLWASGKAPWKKW